MKGLVGTVGLCLSQRRQERQARCKEEETDRLSLTEKGCAKKAATIFALGLQAPVGV